MKVLFTDFLSVSLAGAVIICLILLLRFVLKKAPKVLACAMWAVAFVRLMLPFQIEVGWSLRPETPVISETVSQMVTQSSPVPQADVPFFVPQTSIAGTEMVKVDYLGIAALVWMLGVCIMALYVLITYLRLKRHVREAVRVDYNVFASENLQNAFLLGYFRPRIYLPAGMESGEMEMVIAHELVHIKRGDNWLKLFGMLCLCLHWFNPFVWLAYFLLCRDIEDACDEQVIKNLEIQQRKTYSTALLWCGKDKRKLSVCPVAFGESNIQQRVKKIMNYRKPGIWISIIAILAIVVTAVFFVVDPIPTQEHPPYYAEMMDLLGEPKETVCAELGLTEAELGEEIAGGFYDTPIQVEYEGITFTLQLGFSVYNDLLSSFTYYAAYEGDPNQAAEDTVTISHQLRNEFGKGYQWEENEDPDRLRTITAQDVLDELASESDTTIITDQWDLTDKASKSAKTYLDQIEVSAWWQEVHGERAKLYEVSPHFFLWYTASYNPSENMTYISISYLTGWQPGHYSVVIESDRH